MSIIEPHQQKAGKKTGPARLSVPCWPGQPVVCRAAPTERPRAPSARVLPAFCSRGSIIEVTGGAARRAMWGPSRVPDERAGHKNVVPIKARTLAGASTRHIYTMADSPVGGRASRRPVVPACSGRCSRGQDGVVRCRSSPQGDSCLQSLAPSATVVAKRGSRGAQKLASRVCGVG